MTDHGKSWSSFSSQQEAGIIADHHPLNIGRHDVPERRKLKSEYYDRRLNIFLDFYLCRITYSYSAMDLYQFTRQRISLLVGAYYNP